MCILYTFKGGIQMRTNVVIDDVLMEEAFSVSQSKTKKEIIHEALKELIRLKKRKDLADLAGRISFYTGFDHKALRKIR
jgi:Arc/MetJ family transcription regulator